MRGVYIPFRGPSNNPYHWRCLARCDGQSPTRRKRGDPYEAQPRRGDGNPSKKRQEPGGSLTWSRWQPCRLWGVPEAGESQGEWEGSRVRVCTEGEASRITLMTSRALSRAATGDRGARACAADIGLPMGGAVRSGLGKIIGIVTDSDSCPTLCCLVLTGSNRTEKEMALDTVVSKFLQRWTIFAATKHLLSPPHPPSDSRF